MGFLAREALLVLSLGPARSSRAQLPFPFSVAKKLFVVEKSSLPASKEEMGEGSRSIEGYRFRERPCPEAFVRASSTSCRSSPASVIVDLAEAASGVLMDKECR